MSSTKKLCSKDDCERPVQARGMCSTHYQRWRRSSSGDPRQPSRVRYAEHEMGHILDFNIPATEAAAIVGIAAGTVHELRRRDRLGTLRVSDWFDDEVEFILENYDRMTIVQMAAFLRRDERQVTSEVQRLKKNGVAKPRPGRSMSPCTIGQRRLLAKTCPKCGLLLDSGWFSKDKVSGSRGRTVYNTSCRKCKAEHKSRTRNRDKDKVRHLDYAAKLQAYTQERATKHGEPYTEADEVILADPNRTMLQKAIELKRTFFATNTALTKRGLHSKPDLTNGSGQWHLFWEFDLDELEKAS